MNAKMADLRTCFEMMSFTDVKTALSSGNVVFTGAEMPEPKLAKLIESGMAKDLPRSFPVIVRTTDQLLALLKIGTALWFSPFAKGEASCDVLKSVASGKTVVTHRAGRCQNPGCDRQ